MQAKLCPVVDTYTVTIVYTYGCSYRCTFIST
jgi:pyruvate-formate lyase-activating enzyme